MTATITRLPSGPHQPLPDGHLSGPQLGNVAQITYRQLDYWTRAGYLRALNDGLGSGNYRAYPPTEVSVACLMARLVDAGLNPQAASQLARELTDTGTTHIAGLPIHLPQEL